MNRFVKIEDAKIVWDVFASNKPEWYVLWTDEVEQSLLPEFVSIKIPMQHIVGETASQELLQTVQELKFLYSDIKTKPSPDKQRWVVSNINLADIATEDGAVSQEYYQKLKAIWCVFDQKILDYFEPEEESLSDNEDTDDE